MVCVTLCRSLVNGMRYLITRPLVNGMRYLITRSLVNGMRYLIYSITSEWYALPYVDHY